MKTLLNTKNETIYKFDDFNELKKYLYDNLIEHLCCAYDNKLSQLNYDDMIDVCEYMNDLNKTIKKIQRDCANDNFYLLNEQFILFENNYDDDDDFSLYNIYDCVFDDCDCLCDVEYHNVKYHNEQTLLSYIIDELNKQLLHDIVSYETHNN